ncbi:anti-repressor SinI family protein [Halalkalibacter nanhaiisediminis]|nr:anti-repressor SinI family protein [Halalkalibacter nanhaiisediminis]
MKGRGQLVKLDEEWVVLIKKARKIGFTLDELRKFL